MELSKNKIKQILSLSRKKERDELGFFLAEGNKLVTDLLPFFTCQTLVATKEYLTEHPGCRANEVILSSSDEMKKVSLLCSPQSVLAVFKKPEYSLNMEGLRGKLSLMLDTVQDPGNLGTIIRIADWYGIEDLICSEETADVYNPKVIQATMGAIARVRVHYCNLEEFLKNLKDIPVYGTFLDGENIYGKEFSKDGIIVMGNEGNGISKELKPLIRNHLFIPNYPAGRHTSESLNVAVATAVICAEFRRRM